jgi:hypothetical protein
LVGAGIGGAHRLTGEAVALLESARTVLHLTPLDAELARLCRGAVASLAPVYAESDDPSTTYRRMADWLVEAARDARCHGSYACFATYGHPLLLVWTSRLALARCRREGLRAAVAPGLSSFDTLLIDSPFRLDGGSLVYDAHDFIGRGLGVETRLPLVLLQFGDVGDTRLRPDPADLTRFGPMLDRLRALYPPERAAALVVSPWRTGMRPRVHRSRISSLEEILAFAHTGTTLVVDGDDLHG